MKRLLPILLTLLLGGALYGQTPQGASYQQQYVALYTAYSQDSNDVVTLMQMTTFFADPANPLFNLPLAYGYSQRAEELYVLALQDKKRYRQVRKLIRDGVSVSSLRQIKSAIEEQALAYVRNHVSQMRSYEIAAFKEAFADNKKLQGLLRDKELSDAYARVKDENTLNGYYTFIQQHPHTALADSAEAQLSLLAPRFFSAYGTEAAIDSVAARYPQSKVLQTAAMRQKSRMAYGEALRANNVEVYTAYLERYPQGDDYVDALVRRDELLRSELSTLTTPEELADYVVRHADDPTSEDAMDQLRSMIIDQRREDAVRVYLSRFSLDPQYADIYSAYYNWYAEEGNRAPIMTFAEEHPDFPFGHTIESDLQRADRIDAFDLTQPFMESDLDTMTTIVRILTGRKIAFVALQRSLQQLIARKNWAAAQQRLQSFELSFEDLNQAEYAELSNLLTGPGGPMASPFYSGENISHLLATPDPNKIYFVKHNKGQQLLCFAERKDSRRGVWYVPVAVTVKGAQGEVTPYCFYDDGHHVLVGIDDDIWTARVVEDLLWELEAQLPAPVNTPYIEKDAFMLEDGSGLLLASDRPGGHNVQKSGSYYHGDNQLATDLYYFPCDGGKWGEAVNLGYGVNSAYCEHSPLLSSNRRTLYFITDARGLGYGDIYCATRSDINDWTHWSKPVNMGRNVNGAFDETSLSFGSSESQIVFTSLSPNGDRRTAYSFATRHDTSSAYRQVQVDYTSVLEVMGNVRLAETSSQTYQDMTQNLDTLATYRLYKEKAYAILVEADWLYVPTLMIGKAKSEATVPNQPYEVRGYTWDELKNMEEPIALPLVRFYDNTARMLPLGELELQILGHYLKQRTQATIDVEVRVKGKDDRRCYDLSLERAQAIRAFLVKCGVDASRIRIEAYGNVEYKRGEKRSEVTVVFG